MNSIFFDPANITMAALNERCENTLNTALGIVFTELGTDYLCAEMPVDERTIQPLGMLNGGASLSLIETLGSMAGNLCLDREKYVAFGQSVTCNHIKPAFRGEMVRGKATPVHLGRTSQVWDVSIYNQKGSRICKGSITLAVVSKP
ncbi:MAG: hotdog fold thioesterase [Sphingomonadales bacterium]